jgi:DegV family protein with EDD domain
MSLAIIADSTCDLTLEELNDMNVARVSLYINFQGRTWKDWEEITPKDIVEGVRAGADLPSTSQPSPQDFQNAYEAAVGSGATEILVITISSEMSGTYQSAMIARDAVDVPVTVFDSRAASVGIGDMVKRAAQLRAAGKPLAEILPVLEEIRDTNKVFFTVASMDYLVKGGRVGKGAALLGGMLNIKPILTVTDGHILPQARARGTRKALAEIVTQVRKHLELHPGKVFVTLLHVQDPAAAQSVKDALDAAGIEYEGGLTYEVGPVITSHVGPGTHGLYLHVEQEPETA